jgi:hypothetical protein
VPWLIPAFLCHFDDEILRLTDMEYDDAKNKGVSDDKHLLRDAGQKKILDRVVNKKMASSILVEEEEEEEGEEAIFGVRVWGLGFRVNQSELEKGRFRNKKRKVG